MPRKATKKSRSRHHRPLASKVRLGRQSKATSIRKRPARSMLPIPLVPLAKWSLPELIRRLQAQSAKRSQARPKPSPQATRPPRAHGADEARKGRPPRPAIPIVAVTGTAGKTTTKTMLVSILKQTYRTVTTPGNNNLGTALPSVFRNAQRLKAEVAVLEMGMERRGQIAAQCRYAVPDIGVITNVNQGHLTKCGGFAGVVKAKNELVYGLRRQGTLILNSDDPGTKLLNIATFKGRIIRYGKAQNAAYRLLKIQRKGSHLVISAWAEGKQHLLVIPTVGRHHAYNALAATAAARCLHVPWPAIQKGLRRFIGAPGRLTLRRGVKGSLILDDSFNANPLSVISGLKTLTEEGQGRTTVAILGNMEEQGSQWRSTHELVGRRAVELGVDYLMTIGDKASVIARSALRAGMARWRVMIYPTRQAAARQLIRRIPRDSIILIKGSHSTRLDRIVQLLRKRS